MSKSDVRKVFISLLFPALACAVQLWLWDDFRPYAWSLFYPAVFFSAWYGGRWGGLGAMILSALMVVLFFSELPYSLYLRSPNALTALVVFLFMGWVFGVFHERLRKESGEPLARGEQQYQFLAENVPDVIWILDLETLRYRYVSPSVEHMRGFRVEEVMHQEMSVSVSPASAEHLARVLPERLAALRSGVSKDYVDLIEQPCKDGHTVQTESTTRFVMNRETGHLEVYGISRDITERSSLDEALRRRTEELEQLVDMVPEAIWFAEDQECRIVHGNRFANDLLQVSEDANVSQSSYSGRIVLRHFLNGRELAPEEMPLQSAVRTARPQLDIEVQIQRPDGFVRTLLGGATPLFDTDGRARGAVAAFHDITERKKAEERFVKSFTFNPVGMYIIDLNNGQIVDVNDAFLAIMGLTREQVIGKTTVEVGQSASPAHRQEFLKTMRERRRFPQSEVEFHKRNGEAGYAIICAETIDIGDS
jgi:PAS domain S-box-containing protein